MERSNGKANEILDGTVKLEVGNSKKGKLNLGFTNLDVTVKELDLSKTIFSDFDLKNNVEIKGDKLEGKKYQVKENTHSKLDLNMYGAEPTKPTEAVGTYRFYFDPKDCSGECFKVKRFFWCKKRIKRSGFKNKRGRVIALFFIKNL